MLQRQREISDCSKARRSTPNRKANDSLELDEDEVGNNVVVSGSQSREKDGIDERNERGSCRRNATAKDQSSA